MKTSPAQQTIVDRCNCMANPTAIRQAEKCADGALDACEEVAVAPVVKVSVSPKTETRC